MEALVTIAINDRAHGVFRVYSSDPDATDNGRQVTAEERDQFSVELIIERQGTHIPLCNVSKDIFFVSIAT